MRLLKYGFYKKSLQKKVFNWSVLHFFEVTSYKILILIRLCLAAYLKILSNIYEILDPHLNRLRCYSCTANEKDLK